MGDTEVCPFAFFSAECGALELRYGVVSASAPGVATGYSLDSQPTALDKTVLFQSLDSIL